MADGDLYTTVTVEGAGVPTLVTASYQGSIADEGMGSIPRSRGTGAQETRGTDAQETTGTAPRGNNGRVI